MADYGSWRYGAVSFPLTAATTNTLLQDADPALHYALDFISSMIATHVGARLVAQATAAGAPITSAVAMKVPLDPAPHLLTAGYQFPLLAIYRKSETLVSRTKSRREDACELECAYILPPLTAGQAEAIEPILRAVGRVLDNRVAMGADPAYTPPGGTAGQSVWALANISGAEVTRGSYGMYADVNDRLFKAWTGTLVLREVTREGVYASTFAGADLALDVVDPDLTTIGNLVQVATTQAPTVTLVTPSTGVAAGGTSVTITGTLFATGATVTIAGIPCAGVTVVSATSITATTGAHAALLSDVVVTNLDGQSGTLTDGFTYT